MEVWDIFRDCKSGIDFENTVVKFLRCLAFEANKDREKTMAVLTLLRLQASYPRNIHFISSASTLTHLWVSIRSKRFYAGTNYYGGNGKPVVITNNKVTVDARVYAKRLGV